MKRLLVALALAAALAPARADAGAWTRDQWGFYLQLSTSFNWAGERYNLDGNKVPILVRQFSGANTTPNRSDFQQLFSDLYFELGLWKRLTFFGDFPFLASQREHNEGGDIVYSANGIGDLLLGLRYALIEAPFALAVETRITFPTGDPNAVIPLGQGDWRPELRLVASHALPQLPIYFDLEFGFTLRGNTVLHNLLGTTVVNYASELVLHAEVGATLVRYHGRDRVLLVASLEHRQSTSRPADNVEPVFLTIIPDNSRFTTVGPNLLVYFTRYLGASVRFSQAVAGSRLPVLSTVGVGLFGTL